MVIALSQQYYQDVPCVNFMGFSQEMVMVMSQQFYVDMLSSVVDISGKGDVNSFAWMFCAILSVFLESDGDALVCNVWML